MQIEMGFWDYLQYLIDERAVVIDRPRGSNHPNFPDFVYPVDYGYLEGTRTSDGDGVDVWVGSKENQPITSILCTVDLNQRNIELKVLLGCTDDEIYQIMEMTNDHSMRALLISRDE